MATDIYLDSQAVETRLAASLAGKLAASGWTAKLAGDLLTAEKEVILAKWPLGSRRVKHRLLLRLDAAARKLTMRESATEISIGIPPPAFSVSVSSQQGLEVTQDRMDSGIGGGGALHYGEPRKWVEQECAGAGWTFVLVLAGVV